MVEYVWHNKTYFQIYYKNKWTRFKFCFTILAHSIISKLWWIFLVYFFRNMVFAVESILTSSAQRGTCHEINSIKMPTIFLFISCCILWTEWTFAHVIEVHNRSLWFLKTMTKIIHTFQVVLLHGVMSHVDLTDYTDFRNLLSTTLPDSQVLATRIRSIWGLNPRWECWKVVWVDDMAIN